MVSFYLLSTPSEMPDKKATSPTFASKYLILAANQCWIMGLPVAICAGQCLVSQATLIQLKNPNIWG